MSNDFGDPLQLPVGNLPVGCRRGYHDIDEGLMRSDLEHAGIPWIGPKVGRERYPPQGSLSGLIALGCQSPIGFFGEAAETFRYRDRVRGSWLELSQRLRKLFKPLRRARSCLRERR